MIQNTEKIQAREDRLRLRRTRMMIILGSVGHYYREIVKVMEGLGIKSNRIARRLASRKPLTPTQYYKIS